MSHNIDPSKEQFEQFKNLPRDTPIMMLNLIALNKSANYKDATIATGAEAYASYGTASSAIFSSVGGQIMWRGNPENILIGPSDEHWDIAFIASYPNAAAFLALTNFTQLRLTNTFPFPIFTILTIISSVLRLR